MSNVDLVNSYVGKIISYASSEPHHDTIGRNESRLEANGQSPRFIKNSTSGNFIFKI